MDYAQICESTVCVPLPKKPTDAGRKSFGLASGKTLANEASNHTYYNLPTMTKHAPAEPPRTNRPPVAAGRRHDSKIFRRA